MNREVDTAEAYIYDITGKGHRLPQLLSWDISHGFGSPCDSFELSFIHSPESFDLLEKAVDFRACHEGRTVFKGRIDEFSVSASAKGCIARLSGRGMQALLLDNEAESAEYYNADMTYILSRHARELGIEDIDAADTAGSTARFEVESGMSHWGVISEFAEFCCGVRPRFSPEGCLVMNGEKPRRSLKIDSAVPLKEIDYREDRYGVISSIKVKKYSRGGSLTEDNAEFLAKGGRCHRVINVPKKTGYDSMRFSARYQIRKSMEDYQKCRVELPWLFAAFPGDRVEADYTPLGLAGSFMVVGSRCRCDAAAAYTQLEMRRI